MHTVFHWEGRWMDGGLSVSVHVYGLLSIGLIGAYARYAVSLCIPCTSTTSIHLYTCHAIQRKQKRSVHAYTRP